MSDQPEQEPAHVRLAPSSSSRWTKCGGSARTDLPDTTNASSTEGSLAHEVGKSLLTGGDIPEEWEAKLNELSDSSFDEMYSCVGLYADYVRGIPGELHVEEKIISETLPEFGGTIDALRDHPDFLHVVDLKYGIMFVPAANNPQLKCYLVLAREKYGRRPIYRGTIVQPRVLDGRIETWEYTDEELDEWFVTVIEASQDDSIVAGEHCRWCPLLATCDVAYHHAKEMADMEFSEVVDEIPGEALIPRLVEIVEFEDVVSALAKLAKDKMLEYIRAGGSIEEYKAAQSLGHRAFIDPDTVADTLHREGVSTEDIFDPPTLKSPAQMEKKVPKTLIAPLCYRPERGIVLVKRSSKLQEITFDEFDAIPE